ncbi:unnamed protein product [Rotaria sp. Silwood2]|nr:unnamed protein product [Rotaria sp. Silwood2]
MSTPTISTVAYISQQIVRYFGIPIFVAGVIGAILSTTVLFSLQTFRQNSCAFYLALMSIFDLSELIISLLSFIMINGFGIDWTQNSIVYCKVRLYSIQVFGLIAKNYLCLATIDQFLATTTTRPQWQQWCTVKLARRLCLACGLLWAIVGIPFIIYYDLIKSSLTGKLTCVITSNNFLQYYNTFHSMFVQSCLFVITTGIFGLLAYRNIQQSSHQVLPIIRRGLAKQLTVMVLVQVIFNFFAILPYTIINAILFIPNITNDPTVDVIIKYARLFSVFSTYVCFASPFYIYLCVSERFRHQLVYVLFRHHLKQAAKKREVLANQVVPQESMQLSQFAL